MCRQLTYRAFGSYRRALSIQRVSPGKRFSKTFHHSANRRTIRAANDLSVSGLIYYRKIKKANFQIGIINFNIWIIYQFRELASERPSWDLSWKAVRSEERAPFALHRWKDISNEQSLFKQCRSVCDIGQSRFEQWIKARIRGRKGEKERVPLNRRHSLFPIKHRW